MLNAHLTRILAAAGLVASVALAQTKAIGIFSDQGSVGQTPPGVKAAYDPVKGEYRITGGGENIWNSTDSFYFVWKKASGDMTLTADVEWVGTSDANHRKAVVMIRQSLDPGSAYADAVSHGDGLTSLQFRGAANEQTYQIFTNIEGRVRLRLVREGSRFTMYAGKPGEELKPVGPVEYVSLKGSVYVGLGVCSHVATTLETAVFSNVKLEERAAAVSRPAITGIANIAIKVKDFEEARKFYTGVVGLEEAFQTTDSEVPGKLSSFKVNDRQFVEISPTLQGEEDRLIRIGFETADASRLRDYLASKGVAVPSSIGTDANHNRSFSVKDPDGNRVQFVEYLPGSLHSRDAGQHLSANRLSDHILHVGARVADASRSDSFYKDILGFRPQWKGGPTDDRFEWVSLMVPDGHDWMEYMVRPDKLTPKQLGVFNHYSLETVDIQKLYKAVLDRGYKPLQEPAIARDGRWLLQLYDPTFTRTEIMVRKPVQPPCCSPNLDDFK